MTAVSLQGIAKAWPGAAHPVFEDITLDLPSGRITALLGPSGCGKTTVMKIVAGLAEPTAGRVLFDGKDAPTRPETRGAVMVFQNGLLFPYMTLAENVGFGLRMRHLPKAQVAARVTGMLEAVQLTGLQDRRPHQLSGGQQQRAALARALIVEPKVLLLDEPLSNLDAHLRAGMRDLIRDLQHRTGITTLIVTHDQDEAVTLADQMALMLGGRLHQTGQPETFYRRPADIQTARFFGGCNFISGKAGGGIFRSVLPPLSLPPDCPDGPGLLTIRPEALRLETAAENTVDAVVTDRRFQGPLTRIALQAAGQALTLHIAQDIAGDAMPGGTVSLHLPRDALWVVPDPERA